MKTTQRLLICLLVALFALGCTDSPKSEGTKRASQAADTLYTRQAAMSIYAYQPRQALQIIDSAVIVGNLSEWQAQLCKARIFSSTQMYDELDSLLGGPKDVRLDTARAIGERLLCHDSVKADLRRQLGDSQATNALRAEAEIGAALCALGQWEQGMAKLDSAIYQLDASFYRLHNPDTFDEATESLKTALQNAKAVVTGVNGELRTERWLPQHGTHSTDASSTRCRPRRVSSSRMVKWLLSNKTQRS